MTLSPLNINSAKNICERSEQQSQSVLKLHPFARSLSSAITRKLGSAIVRERTSISARAVTYDRLRNYYLRIGSFCVYV